VDVSYFQIFYYVPETTVKDIGGHQSAIVCHAAPNNCSTANLNLQYITSVATNVNTTFYYDGNSSDFVVSWVQTVANMANPPNVLLISYGVPESQVTAAHSKAFETAVLMLASMGVTVVVSSGDDGAGGVEAAQGLGYCSYAPVWPASSLYVLSVGATQGPESGSSEVACSSDTSGIITSGGGFSNLYDRPEYQNTAVQSYLSKVEGTTNQPVTGYNQSGRAYPDLALMGFNYIIIVGNDFPFRSVSCVYSSVMVDYRRHQLCL
jgi:tripeptidyl-peptidase-1